MISNYHQIDVYEIMVDLLLMNNLLFTMKDIARERGEFANPMIFFFDWFFLSMI